MRWLSFVVFVVVPLLVLPGMLRELKFQRLLREERLEGCVSFGYEGNHWVTCYTPGADGQGTGYVFLPSFADLDAIRVETEAFRVEFEQGGQMFSVSGGEEASCSFLEQVSYTVRFYDFLGREAGTKSMVFLKSGGLPTLYVNTESGSMERLDADKRYKEGASGELVGPDGGVLFCDVLKNISGRGNHTFEFEKKSYQIKLRTPEDLLGMGASDTWILLSNVYDRSYIRNKLTYDMALEAGMAGSPQSRYIDVYLNGVYNGMYLLCEKVEIGDNRLELSDLEKQNKEVNGGNLEEAYRFLSDDEKRKGTALLRNPEDITGGYLVEHDYGPKYAEEISGFITEGGEEFVLKSPQHASVEEVDYIAGLMQQLEDAIRSEDGCNPVTGEYYSQYLDSKSWADKYLVEEISRNNGGGLSSSYFYKPEDAVSTRVFGGPVWDYDKAYARVPGCSANARDLGFLTMHNGKNTRWFSCLYQQEDFRLMIKKEYQETFRELLSYMVEVKIPEYLNEIEASAILDKVRFGPVYLDYAGEMDYRAEAGRVADFILRRRQFLDEVWLSDAPICRVHFLTEEGKEWHCHGVIAGECMEELPCEDSTEEVEFLGWKLEGTDTYFTNQTPVTEDLTVVGVWKECEQ